MNETNRQILYYAKLFLQSKGYNGFSYRDISQKLGIKNAAIHNYYPKKEDLIAKILEDGRNEIAENFSQVVKAGGTGRDQLQSYFDYTLRDFDEGRCICPPGSMIVNNQDLPKKVQEQNILFVDEVISGFSKALRFGLENGEFEFNGTVEERAKLIIGILLGTRQLATIKGRRILLKSIELIKADIGWKE
jgi:TetR/AcrR family transcriptional repressor of nem operon